MADCYMLLMQLNAARGQLNTLQGQLLTLTNSLNAAILNAITIDDLGGTMPSAPYTTTNVSARVAYLDGLINPSLTQAQIDHIHAAMSAWGGVVTLIPTVAAKQAEVDAQAVVVEGIEDQCETNNCF